MAVTPTYVPLGTITLASGVTSATFSSIPAGYRDLIIVVNGGRTTGTAAVEVRFNSDTGANYSWLSMFGNGSSTGSNTQGAFNTFIPMAWNANITTSFDYMGIAQVMDYSATDKHKTMLVRNGRASGATEAIAGRWANTAAINTIQIIVGTAIAGTTISIYGVN